MHRRQSRDQILESIERQFPRKQYLSVADVAAVLGVSQRTLYNQCTTWKRHDPKLSGRFKSLPLKRRGSRRNIAVGELADWIYAELEDGFLVELDAATAVTENEDWSPPDRPRRGRPTLAEKHKRQTLEPELAALPKSSPPKRRRKRVV